jgi:hypothetical protein
MKLREVNKEHNRRFHELPTCERIEFLQRAYAEVFPQSENQKGEFTPPDPTRFPVSLSREDRAALQDTANKLNFLMTRFNMERSPAFENRVRELALLRFEYLFLIGDPGLTQNPELVANFFTKRGKPELIRPALERMGAHAVDYEHLAERTIDHPVFKRELGLDAVIYKFRSRLHILVEDNDYSKEQAAAALIDEGFDLKVCDFNRWFKVESDFNLKLGDKKYRESPKERAWLDTFVAEVTAHGKPHSNPLDDDASVKVPEDDEEPGREVQGSKAAIKVLDKSVQHTLAQMGEDPAFYWVKELVPLTSDHSELSINSTNLVEAKMWDYLWGGEFNKLAYQLKGANPHGKTRKGLNYNKWALTHEEHSKAINPILAQDSYAMIIAGDLLVGDLDVALQDLGEPGLQRYRNEQKIRAAVNLAWEMFQHPGESDERENYEPPRAYLFHVAQSFGNYLTATPTAAPYLKLASAEVESSLGKEEAKILGSISNFDGIEKAYNKLGISDKIRERFLEVFDDIYDRDTKYISLQSEVRGIIAAIQHPIFRKYVDDETIGQRLRDGVQRTLERKNKYDADRDESGSQKLVLTLYQNSVLRPYLEGKVDISKMVNGMINDVIGRNDDLLTAPYSLRNQGELTIVPSEVIEAYMIADKFRQYVNPETMGRLVAYLLALNSEMTAGNSFNLTSRIIDKVGEQADPSYNRPEYFPNADGSEREQRIEFLSNVFNREKELGGLDWATASTGVTNVIFRGTYVQPGRFYPRLDTVMGFLDSPVAKLLPSTGLGDDAVKEYRILKDFLKS